MVYMCNLHSGGVILVTALLPGLWLLRTEQQRQERQRKNPTYRNLQCERVQKLKNEERADAGNNHKNVEF